jgi:ADP-ribosyl-[dinitrogen reductase] hydrolase
MNKDTIERAVGALIGSIVGDALGAPFEFGPAGAFGHRFADRLLVDPSEMVGGGQWEPAEWTDDTQMALLVAESLLDRSGLDQAQSFRPLRRVVPVVAQGRRRADQLGAHLRSTLADGGGRALHSVRERRG